MSKLPMHPVVFIVIYLLLAIVTVLPLLSAVSSGTLLSAAAVCGALALQIFWVVQAVRFAGKIRMKDRATTRGLRQIKTVDVVVIIAFLCILFDVIYRFYINEHLVEGTWLALILDGIYGICEGLPAILIFSVFWIAAKGLCEAEQEGHVPWHQVVGTFLLFLYLVIGAPFIYHRLKKLRSRS